MLNSYGKRVTVIDYVCLCDILMATVYAKINPYNYVIYWDALFDSKINHLIDLLDHDRRLDILTKILEHADIEQLRKGNYSFLKKTLCSLNSINYSPIFDNDFSFTNIYFTLLNIIKKNPIYFKSLDIQFLEYLFDISNCTTKEERIKLAKKIQSIEKRNGDNPIETCRQAIHAIRNTWAKTIGIGIITNPHIVQQK